MPSDRQKRILWLVVALALMLAGVARAEEVRRIGLSMMVSYVSQKPGPVDPAGRELHRQLRRDFSYRSLRVLEKRRLKLRLDEVKGVRLPTGRLMRMRPLHVGKGGLLLAVDVEGKVQTDLRVRNHQPISIGIERYQDGKLVVTLEPDF
jgi:hypothetical protein